MVLVVTSLSLTLDSPAKIKKKIIVAIIFVKLNIQSNTFIEENNYIDYIDYID
jgi:hypothetical protein